MGILFPFTYKKLIDTFATDGNIEEWENEQKLKNREFITLSKQHLYKIVLCDSQIRMSAGLDTTSSKHSSNMFLKSAMADYKSSASYLLKHPSGITFTESGLV